MRSEGLELKIEPFPEATQLFSRMVKDAEFEVAEMSLSTLIMMIAKGDDRLVGIPVFLSRAFRHSQVYVHARSGITRPEHPVGRLVGIPEYQMTAALWVRAFLKHDYGVAPRAAQVAYRVASRYDLLTPAFAYTSCRGGTRGHTGYRDPLGHAGLSTP